MHFNLAQEFDEVPIAIASVVWAFRFYDCRCKQQKDSSTWFDGLDGRRAGRTKPGAAEAINVSILLSATSPTRGVVSHPPIGPSVMNIEVTLQAGEYSKSSPVRRLSDSIDPGKIQR